MSSRDHVPEPAWLTQGPPTPEVNPWTENLAEVHSQAGAEVYDAWIQFTGRCKRYGYTPRMDSDLFRKLKEVERMFDAEAEVIRRDGMVGRRQIVKAKRGLISFHKETA